MQGIIYIHGQKTASVETGVRIIYRIKETGLLRLNRFFGIKWKERSSANAGQ